MSNSVRERILQAIEAVLAPVAASCAAQFFRQPSDPLGDGKTPAIMLLPESDQVKELSGNKRLTQRELELTIAVVSRQAGRSGPAPEPEADALLVAAHAALHAWALSSPLRVTIAETDTSWEAKTLDVKSTVTRTRYRIGYFTYAADLTSQPD